MRGAIAREGACRCAPRAQVIIKIITKQSSQSNPTSLRSPHVRLRTHARTHARTREAADPPLRVGPLRHGAVRGSILHVRVCAGCSRRRGRGSESDPSTSEWQPFRPTLPTHSTPGPPLLLKVKVAGNPGGHPWKEARDMCTCGEERGARGEGRGAGLSPRMAWEWNALAQPSRASVHLRACMFEMQGRKREPEGRDEAGRDSHQPHQPHHHGPAHQERALPPSGRLDPWIEERVWGGAGGGLEGGRRKNGRPSWRAFLAHLLECVGAQVSHPS